MRRRRAIINNAGRTANVAFELRTATQRDENYIDALQRHFFRHVGCVNRAAREDRLIRQDYWLLTVNSAPAGFVLLTGGVRRCVRLSQVAIDPELWRRGLGSAVIHHVRAHARAHERHDALVCAVADTLPMNEVCAATGALHAATRVAVSTHGRRVHHYTWAGTRGTSPDIDGYASTLRAMGRAVRLEIQR